MTQTRPARIRTEQAPGFLRWGYLFASRLREKAGLPATSHTPLSLTLLGKTSVLVRGEEGVRFFYDNDLMERHGAMPTLVQLPLFGDKAVHTLDGEPHRVRKNAMTDLAYDNDRVADFQRLVAEELEAAHGRWKAEEGNVHDDAALAFGRAALRWAGVELSDGEMDRRVRQMNRLLDTFGQLSQNPVAMVERVRLDRWATQLIQDVRSGQVTAAPDSVLAHMADLRDENGELVEDKVAAVELQNLTRPTVAVGRFAAFAAAALVKHPEWVERIRAASQQAGGSLTDIPEAVAFAQEVRRTHPFVPMLPALAKKDTEVSGCPVRKGQRVLLDFVGTLTSPAEWRDAGSFDPERFLPYDGVEAAESITAFIPQGGGDVRTGHRCPGEKITVSALAAAVVVMCRPDVTISSDVKDTTFPWTRMLTRPATGVRISATG
ncbi:cytochrome P450 [Corynebacterium hylobatis]|uniref:Cytochrome P450 n=1 Tax=Corynebacterium hylobatis TaxID=1859290 RepID=A0A430I180_9CORY|nr:cytochrome P450 [Corynebacterium hylobatis]RSZ65510.1 cytochrome P450 [Corynebacterium hylobatis]